MPRQAPPEDPGSPSSRLRQASRRSTFAVSTSRMGNGGSIGRGLRLVAQPKRRRPARYRPESSGKSLTPAPSIVMIMPALRSTLAPRGTAII